MNDQIKLWMVKWNYERPNKIMNGQIKFELLT